MSQESDQMTPGTDIASAPALSLRQWLLLAVCCVAILALLSAHAPGRIRLIGLFAVVFGLVAGGILGTAARNLKFANTRLLVPLTFVLIACGEAGMTTESHRVYITTLKAVYEKDIPSLPLQLMKEQGSLETPKLDVQQQMKTAGKISQSFHEDRLQILKEQSGFFRYLRYRISPLGEWAVPFATVFWICEVILGSLSGTWFAIYTIRSGKRLDENEPLG